MSFHLSLGLKNASSVAVTFIITPHALLNISHLATLGIRFDARD